MSPPEQALLDGHWVKLICGASNQDLVSIEDLCGIYALAGVHCIDVAADPAVAAAARRGIAWARERQAADRPPPWLMLSLSDGADPHFRKAWFDPRSCPPDCPRPCARVCPAQAIPEGEGVLAERCYGCGRCLPACPHGLIEERGHLLAAEAVGPLLARLRPDAVELHTRPERGDAFARRLDQVVASGVPLRRLAVSCGLEAGAGAELAAELWRRFALLRQAGLRPLWQLDGRPMSGDVGAGTAHAAVRLLKRVGPLAPPGPLQLSGGTNERTIALLERDLPTAVAGVAFGGAARKLLLPLLQEAQRRGRRLLDDPELWPRARARAEGLVLPWLQRGACAASVSAASL
ncbi:4Fe-4S binding protein [Synechococcus sp. Tobar12-5m-g]|uniref:Light dependent period protein LdpA domain-containing protein n=1 Tax=unclassified Synechococcus TaxID=2626047 RepID=UPI0020CC7A48|nr:MULTISPECIES: LdpA C-terminal domain-containing domain [unclassified Synechococcus]MCP9773008.1 4Fe-4S binding protein [Synechococcus sp. Tobar12-5m-g]MCP9873843.1 4Fe-4S binding protein [Synechococcus sp. Cruz CV-v-12]